ncbi:unnamed protein product [Mytilus coruscus]|uniref:Uncharacterized protein n=1 Tax=Mytilus coruscus TaxID=42192 RepID=A0A6J8E8D7_MYTCO|nr:unnamed protein product [Mytilus coruscus]
MPKERHKSVSEHSDPSKINQQIAKIDQAKFIICRCNVQTKETNSDQHSQLSGIKGVDQVIANHEQCLHSARAILLEEIQILSAVCDIRISDNSANCEMCSQTFHINCFATNRLQGEDENNSSNDTSICLICTNSITILPKYQHTDQATTIYFQQQLPPQFDINRQNPTVHPTSIPMKHLNTMNSNKDNRSNVTNDGGINRTLTGQTIYYSPPSYMTVKYQAFISPGTRTASKTNQKIAYTHPRYSGTLPSTLHTTMYKEACSMKDHGQHT